MARPRLFRDPVHGQIRYDQVDLRGPVPDAKRTNQRLSWLMLRLIDSPEFQRLRHIRQLGIANLVFHGAEHSRFAHSMGAAFLAQEMFGRICRNMDETVDSEQLLATAAAALLHDIGHGPFSHTLEDTLGGLGVSFFHENLTRRIIEDEGSAVHNILAEVDPAFPQRVGAFFDRSKRDGDHWMYRIVSSQLDADRLDYLLRDTFCTGSHGADVDLGRLLDMLMHDSGTRIAVHLKGIATVEAYLIALDRMYRTVYFHHTSRSAAYNLRAVLHRAWQVYRKYEDRTVFQEYRVEKQPGTLFAEPNAHPLRRLFEKGEDIEVGTYTRLSEYHIWTLIESWTEHADAALSDLARRILHRRLFKTIDLDPHREPEARELMQAARDLARKAMVDAATDETVELYVSTDTSHRTSYRRSVWGSGEPDEAIWIKAGDSARPIDEVMGRTLVGALREELLYPRLVFPGEIRPELFALLRTNSRLRSALLHPELIQVPSDGV